jgi:hypothetical protein
VSGVVAGKILEISGRDFFKLKKMFSRNVFDRFTILCEIFVAELFGRNFGNAVCLRKKSIINFYVPAPLPEIFQRFLWIGLSWKNAETNQTNPATGYMGDNLWKLHQQTMTAKW